MAMVRGMNTNGAERLHQWCGASAQHVRDMSTMITYQSLEVYMVLTSFNYEKNKFYDVKSNLNVRSYSGDRYFMWKYGSRKQNMA